MRRIARGVDFMIQLADSNLITYQNAGDPAGTYMHSPEFSNIRNGGVGLFARLPGLNSTSFILRIDARDADQDDLTYLWEASEGEFIERIDKNETTWKGPQVMQDREYKIFITVSDAKVSIKDSILVSINAPTFGRLNGFAYYRNCKVPLKDAVVSIWGKSDSTNIYGEFEIDGIMAGRQELTASKEDFITNTEKIIISQGLNNADIHLTSSIQTTVLHGQLVGNMTGEPKAYLTVVILNPDFSESDLSVTSDGSGYYELPYVPHGLRYIKVKGENQIMMETSMYLDSPDKLFDIPIKEPFEFTDERDQKTYKAVRIGGQIWMMENLAYLPQVSPAIASKGMWVYGYYGNNTQEAKETFNYKTYGCLYDWTSTEKDNEYAWRRYLYYNRDAIGRFTDFKSNGYSVRCIKDI